jgi:hypothetical protein
MMDDQQIKVIKFVAITLSEQFIRGWVKSTGVKNIFVTCVSLKDSIWSDRGEDLAVMDTTRSEPVQSPTKVMDMNAVTENTISNTNLNSNPSVCRHLVTE